MNHQPLVTFAQPHLDDANAGVPDNRVGGIIAWVYDVTEDGNDSGLPLDRFQGVFDPSAEAGISVELQLAVLIKFQLPAVV